MSPRSSLALGLLSLGLFIIPAGWARAEAGPLIHPTPAALAAIDEARAEGQAEGEATHHPAGSKSPDILALDFPLAIWSVIVFVVLLLALSKFAWKPLLGALHRREEYLTRTLSEAERARADAERLLAEHRAQMAQAADQVRALLDQGRRDAEASSAEILRKAREEADSSRDRAKREIGTARDQALQEVWNQAADLAVSVAGKVLERDLGEDDRRRMVSSALESLPSRPPAVNGHGEGASA